MLSAMSLVVPFLAVVLVAVLAVAAVALLVRRPWRRRAAT